MSRQIWMFPRNKRRMPPLETALILRAIVVASKLGTTWGGDQEQQKKFTKMLEDYGLKKKGVHKPWMTLNFDQSIEFQMIVSFVGLDVKALSPKSIKNAHPALYVCPSNFCSTFNSFKL